MTATAPPRPPRPATPSPAATPRSDPRDPLIDPDALIEEARKRARRRRRLYGASFLLAAAAGAGALFGSGYGSGDRADASSAAAKPAVAMSPYHHNGQIVVDTSDPPFTRGVSMIAPITGKEVRLPIPWATDLSWSPDGRQMVYMRETGGVWILDLSSGDSRKVMDCGTGPHACSLAWAPDGTRIAVAHDTLLELVDPHDGSRTTVLTFGSDPSSAVSSPSWSPDAQRIAFEGRSGDRRHQLYAVNRNGSNLTPLGEPAPRDSLRLAPAWSPDGSKIAYLASAPYLAPREGWALKVTVVDADGSNPTELLAAGSCYCLGFSPGLAWSPDGTSMALVIPDRGKKPGGLFVMNTDGAGLRLVIKGRVWGRPAWRPVL